MSDGRSGRLQDLVGSVVTGVDLAHEWAEEIGSKEDAVGHTRAGTYALIGVSRSIQAGAKLAEDVIAAWMRVDEILQTVPSLLATPEGERLLAEARFATYRWRAWSDGEL